MNKNLNFLLAFFLLIGTSVAEPNTLDSKTVLKKVNKALNITPEHKKIKTLQQTGTVLIVAMKMKGAITIKTKADKILVQSNIANMVDTQCVSGNTGWANNISTGVRDLTPAEVLFLQADSLKYTFNQEAFYDSIKVLGKETFNNQQCLKLSFHKEGLDPSIGYFNAKTYLPVGEVQVIASPMGKMTVSVVFKEMAKHKLGFLYPKTLEQTVGPMKMTVSIDSIEVNTPINDDIFKKPTQ